MKHDEITSALLAGTLRLADHGLPRDDRGEAPATSTEPAPQITMESMEQTFRRISVRGMRYTFASTFTDGNCVKGKGR